VSFAPDPRFGSRPPAPTSAAAHLLMALGIALLFALVMYIIRAPVPRVVGCGLVIAAGAFVLLRAMEVGRVDWPAPPQRRVGRSDSLQRWRLNGFDAAVDKVPGFSPQLQVRLRDLATAILARDGTVPRSPEAVALLGTRTHALLYPPDRQLGQARPDDPAGDELVRLIDRLIELSAAHQPNRKGT
jgi:hypothetical protein